MTEKLQQIGRLAYPFFAAAFLGWASFLLSGNSSASMFIGLGILLSLFSIDSSIHSLPLSQEEKREAREKLKMIPGRRPPGPPPGLAN